MDWSARTIRAMRLRRTRRLVRSLCTSGLLLGTLFFAASLTPSLVPRTPLMQGMLSGFAFAAGYAIGVGARWLWSYLELPIPPRRYVRIIQWTAAAISLGTAIVFLWRAAEWQNSIRDLMGMEPVEGAQPFQVGAIALVVFAALLSVGRLFQWTFLTLSRRFDRVIPRRVAYVLGFAIALTLFWSIANGLLFSVGLRVADSSFRQLDALIEPDVERPANPIRTGSEASSISWDELGRRGRQFVSIGPTSEDIDSFLGEPAMEPIRVYVGLNSAQTVRQRAELALEELKRVDAFERSALILVTPTGTGWIDPGGIESIEYLMRGDVASVAVQYSYLASWLALLTEPGYGAETARALFNEVYGHWASLPEDERPDLYLHGLSLGALNSDRSADLFDVIGDPFHGALWSGPPFQTETWLAAAQGRQAGSPEWLPRFRDGSVIRFANQFGGLDIAEADWGPMRIVFLQHASDPITFFRPEILYRSPDWLETPRGPDVSDELQWFPVVTFLQLIADIPASTNAPRGFAHVFAVEDYIDAWREIVRPAGWSEGDIDRLKAHLAAPG